MILELLGYASLTTLLMNFEPYHKLLDFLYLNKKPFVCTMCMGFWVSVLPLMVSYGLKGILYSALSSLAAELIDRKINQL